MHMEVIIWVLGGGSRSAHQTWQQATFLAEPTSWPVLSLLMQRVHLFGTQQLLSQNLSESKEEGTSGQISKETCHLLRQVGVIMSFEPLSQNTPVNEALLTSSTSPQGLAPRSITQILILVSYEGGLSNLFCLPGFCKIQDLCQKPFYVPPKSFGDFLCPVSSQ